MSSIQEIIAAAEATTTCNTWTGKMTSGKTHTILNFPTRVSADEVARDLREAGAEVKVERSAYGEYILSARYTV